MGQQAGVLLALILSFIMIRHPTPDKPLSLIVTTVSKINGDGFLLSVETKICFGCISKGVLN